MDVINVFLFVIVIIMSIFIDSETKHCVYKLLTFRHIYTYVYYLYAFLVSIISSKHQSINIVEY
jgi:hypothetical protein